MRVQDGALAELTLFSVQPQLKLANATILKFVLSSFAILPYLKHFMDLGNSSNFYFYFMIVTIVKNVFKVTIYKSFFHTLIYNKKKYFVFEHCTYCNMRQQKIIIMQKIQIIVISYHRPIQVCVSYRIFLKHIYWELI